MQQANHSTTSTPLKSYSLLLLFWCLLLTTGCNTRDGNGSKTGKPARVHHDSPLQDEHQLKGNTPGADTMSFEAAFAHFFAALQAADTVRLQQFVDPVLGLWVIEQPGAMPKMTHVLHLDKFKREYQDRSFLTVREEVRQCQLAQEPFPAFDCAEMEGEKSGYSKDGCFAWQPDKFRQSGYWDYASLTETQLRQINKTLPLVQKSVLHTKTSFEFHFGFVNAHWRLLFVKLIYPCSA